MEVIESPENKRIKRLIRLRDKRSERDKEGVFIAEGKRWFLDERVDFGEIYLTREEAEDPDLKDKLSLNDKNTFIIKESLMERISDTKTPQGILAVIKKPEFKLLDIIKKKNAIILFLEDIQDPGNLGTIIRTAEAAGVSGIIVTENTADIYQPKVVRATVGSILRLPHIKSKDIKNEINLAKDEGTRIFSTLPEAGDVNIYTNEDFRGKTAFLIGNEARGLKEDTKGLSDSFITIPMQGKIESLNAGVAASILLYEAARQRDFKI